MVRLCANDHEVREGMFVCPQCGSEDVAEREGVRGPADRHDVSEETRRKHAEEQLTGFINRGLVLLGLGLVGAVFSFWAVTENSPAAASFFSFVGWLFAAAGGAYLLCGIVGWGVKYGNEATARD